MGTAAAGAVENDDETLAMFAAPTQRTLPQRWLWAGSAHLPAYPQVDTP